jgi:pimeloyl-ACP methyl ester carboxylesterase
MFALAMVAPVAMATTMPSQAGSVGNCRIGAYRLRDGSLVDIAPTDKDGLRWRKLDGTTGVLTEGADHTWTSTLGWTDRPDGKTATFGDCGPERPAATIELDHQAGERVSFDVRETTFAGAGAKLAGRLVLPKGAGKVPVVVLVHGSERTSARDFYPLQRLLPAQGVAVFVFDKRGTGGSSGAFTVDFSVLANDSAAAIREARRLAGPRAGRVGLLGASQGGWIAPLAATRTPVDFVVSAFGLAVSPIEEDLEEVELEMTLKGHSREDIAKALEVTKAGEAIALSKFTTGFDAFDAVRAKYKQEAWYKDLRGNLLRELLPFTGAELRVKAKEFADDNIPLDYDSVPVLRRVKAPQLWILGADDLDAPSAETGRRLAALVAEGKPITVAVFAHAEHGIIEYEMKDGERVSTRYADGYYAMLRDYLRDGRLGDHYGASTVHRPGGR